MYTSLITQSHKTFKYQKTRDTKWNDIWLGKFLGWKRPNSPVMQCHIPEQYPQPHCYENLRNDNAKYFSFLDYFFGNKTLQLTL